MRNALFKISQCMAGGLTFNEVYDLLSLEIKDASKSYKRMAIQKSIVNNEKRMKLGEIGDFFYEENGLIYPYTGQECTIYRFDKEGSKNRAEIEKVESKKRIDAFIKSYDHNYSIHYSPPKNKILIIAGCCKEKNEREGNMRAIDRYEGSEITILKKLHEILDFDLYIISAKFGLIPEDTQIPYYDKTFNDLKLQEIDKILNILHIRDDFEKVISGYDAVILIAGNKYIRTLNPKKKIDSQIPFIYFSLDKNAETRNELKINNGIEIRLKQDYLIKKYKNYCSINLKSGILYEYFKIHSESDFLKNPVSIKEVIK